MCSQEMQVSCASNMAAAVRKTLLYWRKLPGQR